MAEMNILFVVLPVQVIREVHGCGDSRLCRIRRKDHCRPSHCVQLEAKVEHLIFEDTNRRLKI